MVSCRKVRQSVGFFKRRRMMASEWKAKSVRNKAVVGVWARNCSTAMAWGWSSSRSSHTFVSIKYTRNPRATPLPSVVVARLNIGPETPATHSPNLVGESGQAGGRGAFRREIGRSLRLRVGARAVMSAPVVQYVSWLGLLESRGSFQLYKKLSEKASALPRWKMKPSRTMTRRVLSSNPHPGQKYFSTTITSSSLAAKW